MRAASGTDPPPPGTAKQQWRRWAREIRSPVVPVPVSKAVTDGILAWMGSPSVHEGTVVLYLPLPDEVDVTAVIGSIDRSCAVTRTPGEGPLTLHPADSPRERHRYGFEQPVAHSPRVDPGEVSVVLVPGLVFDLHGGRLGRGGGYYDRFLPTLPTTVKRVGVTTETLIVEGLPIEPHDVPMTHLATESGVRNLSRRPF